MAWNLSHNGTYLILTSEHRFLIQYFDLRLQIMTPNFNALKGDTGFNNDYKLAPCTQAFSIYTCLDLMILLFDYLRHDHVI